MTVYYTYRLFFRIIFMKKNIFFVKINIYLHENNFFFS